MCQGKNVLINGLDYYMNTNERDIFIILKARSFQYIFREEKLG